MEEFWVRLEGEECGAMVFWWERTVEIDESVVIDGTEGVDNLVTLDKDGVLSEGDKELPRVWQVFNQTYERIILSSHYRILFITFFF